MNSTTDLTFVVPDENEVWSKKPINYSDSYLWLKTNSKTDLAFVVPDENEVDLIRIFRVDGRAPEGRHRAQLRRLAVPVAHLKIINS
jgi:hypothetical protein